MFWLFPRLFHSIYDYTHYDFSLDLLIWAFCVLLNISNLFCDNYLIVPSFLWDFSIISNAILNVLMICIHLLFCPKAFLYCIWFWLQHCLQFQMPPLPCFLSKPSFSHSYFSGYILFWSSSNNIATRLPCLNLLFLHHLLASQTLTN